MSYYATLAGPSVTSANYAAIFAGPFAGPQLIAREGDAAPGTSPGVIYSVVNSFSTLTDAGHISYFATLGGPGVTSFNDRAAFAGPLGSPQLVAREGNDAPGTPSGVKYINIDEPAINDAGRVAYHANLTGPGVTTENEDALFAGPFSAPQLFAREGDHAHGTSAGVNYSFFSRWPALNDAGQIAFAAGLTGTGVTNNNDFALFAFDPALGTQLIAREGSLFDVDPTAGVDLRTIAADGGITFVATFVGGFSDDKPTGLSNEGTVAFRLTFTDGTRGIFTPVIPEPALTCVVAAGLLLVGRRRRQGPPASQLQ